MNIKLTVLDTTYSPIGGLSVSGVQPDPAGTTAVLASGTTDDLGVVSLDLGTLAYGAYAVLISDAPVLTPPGTLDAEGVIDLGSIVYDTSNAISWPAFHTNATGGLAYGGPKDLLKYIALLVSAASGGGSTGDDGSADADPTMESVLTAISSAIASSASATSGAAATSADAGSSATSRGATAAASDAGSGTSKSSAAYTLTSVKVTAKCLLSSSGDSVSLGFLDRDSLSSVDANHLSSVEVAYAAPRGTVSTGTTTTASTVPDLSGYTRELAVRKIEAAGLIAELNSVTVTSADKVGRVVGQSPLAGASPSSDNVVRLYIGIQRS